MLWKIPKKWPNRLYTCMFATYRSDGGCWIRSYEGCWTAFGAAGWQPNGLMGVAGLWRCRLVGNLQLLGAFGAVCWQPTACWAAFGAVGWQPTYKSYGGCLTAFGTVGWQLTGLLRVAGWPLGLYVGNLQLLWGLLGFGAVCWQPTGLMGVAGRPLGLYVGNLQLL